MIQALDNMNLLRCNQIVIRAAELSTHHSKKVPGPSTGWSRSPFFEEFACFPSEGMALLQVHWFHSQSTYGRGELETLKCPCVTSVMNWLYIQGVSLLTAQDPSIPANLHKARFEKLIFSMQQACAFHCCSQVNVAASMQQFETAVLLNDKHSLSFLCSQLMTGSKKSSKTL